MNRWRLRPETHIKRQVTQHDCLPSFLNNGYKRIETVCGEEKNIMYWADWSSQGRTKLTCTGTTSPMNQPWKEPFHLYSLSPHFPQFRQSARAILSSLPDKTHCFLNDFLYMIYFFDLPGSRKVFFIFFWIFERCLFSYTESCRSK